MRSPLPVLARHAGAAGRHRAAPGPTARETAPGLRVYSVDDESIQLTWRGTVAERLVFGAGTARAEVAVVPTEHLRRHAGRPGSLGPHRGGPGTAVLAGLAPDTTHDVWVEAPGRTRAPLGPIRTLRRPPGPLLLRMATLNDIHIGERRFGVGATFEDRHPLPAGSEPYPLRCARAALDEARAWGATHVVVKGDLTRDSEPAEFRTVGRLLGGCGMGADVVLGNHDVRHRVDAASVLSEWGIDARACVRHRDLPGLRLIFVHTPGPGDRWGQVPGADADRVARLAAGAPGPCMVVLHHPPATGPVTLHYPPGVYRRQSADLLRSLAAANPAAVVVAGHTHRNRLHHVHGIPVVETASTKDHPGQWTGYRVFAGGIVQTARRVAAPAALAWTEAGGRALAGQWGRWAPGTLADRSWSMDWPALRLPA